MATSVGDIFDSNKNDNHRERIDKIGITVTSSTTDVYFSAWYLEDTHANPRVFVYAYVDGSGSGTQYAEWTSAIGYNSAPPDTPYINPYIMDSSHSDWSIGWGTPECRWSINNSFFSSTPYVRLLESGNNKSFNSKYERMAFQVVRYMSQFDHTEGDLWIKKYYYVKPRANANSITSAFGKVTYTRNCTVKWKYPFSSTSGTPTHFKVEIIDKTNNVVKASQEISVGNNKSANYEFSWTFSSSSLVIGHANKLRITPYIKYGGNTYKYTNIYTEVDNYITYNPAPTGSLTINRISVLPSSGTLTNVLKTEKNFDIEFKYENNITKYGIANKFHVELIGGGNTIDLGFVTNTDNTGRNSTTNKISTYTINVNKNKLSVGTWYKAKVTAMYSNDLTGTEAEYSNIVKRDPTPLNSISGLQYNNNGTWTSSYPVKYGNNTLSIKWNYDDSDAKNKGVANRFIITFSGTGFNRSYFIEGKSTTFNMSDFPYGVLLSMTVIPAYLDNGTYYSDGSTAQYFIDYVLRDAGMGGIVMLSPKQEEATWFFGDTSVNEKSKFRIVFGLPEDKNVTANTSEKDSYTYSLLKVTYYGDGSPVEKTYDISENTVDPNNPTWICVSGLGYLTYQNTAIIDLTGINLDPEDYEDGKRYRIKIEVESKWGTLVNREYKIKIVDLPIGFSDDDLFPKTGDKITASSFNQFISARNIVATFTNNILMPDVSTGEKIEYKTLASLVDPINKLYEVTRNWVNLKRYELPRAIDGNGIIDGDIPYYQKKNNYVADHIYDISYSSTSLSPLLEVPSDYSKNYDRYFQQPKGEYTYAFRSANNNIPNVGVGEDVPLYSAGEYNVLFSYFTLYHSLATSTVLENKIYYMLQSTKQYADGDTQNHGGWVSIPDIQLYSDYIYELDAKLASGTALATRMWTAFGGSYDEVLNVYQGLFCSIGLQDGKLHLLGNNALDVASTITITADRNVYRFEPNYDLNYIQSTVQDYNPTDFQEYSGFIYVPTELYSDYTYEVTGNVLSYGGRQYCVLGGSSVNGKTYVALFNDVLYNVANDSDIDSTPRVDGEHTYTFSGNGNHVQCTDGGFFLLACRNYQDGLRFIGGFNNVDSFFNNCGKISEIKIKDGNGELVMDFVPEKVNGQNGMRDLVSNVFYAPNDNTKFTTSSSLRTSNGFMIFAPKDYALQDGKILGGYNNLDSLYGDYGRIFRLSIYDKHGVLLYNFIPTRNGSDYGMMETLTKTFYPSNNSSKFYLVEEGQDPPVPI